MSRVRPRELYDSLAGYAGAYFERRFGGRPDYETVSWKGMLRDLEARFGPVAEVSNEPALKDIEGDTRRLLEGVGGETPFRPYWAADSVLARCCYLMCRLLEPEVVVETGVAYGVSSAFILKALEQNGRGTLHSIDLPPPGLQSEEFRGIAVPGSLRERWTLHEGAGKRVLPGLLEGLGTLDLFLHDSLHTHRNMLREFGLVWPYLEPGGVTLADDVERNGAFGELKARKPTLWRVVRDRETHPLHGNAAPVTFGVVVK